MIADRVHRLSSRRSWRALSLLVDLAAAGGYSGVAALYVDQLVTLLAGGEA